MESVVNLNYTKIFYLKKQPKKKATCIPIGGYGPTGLKIVYVELLFLRNVSIPVFTLKWRNYVAHKQSMQGWFLKSF